MRLLILLFTFFSTSIVYAQSGVVRKVKGKSAIIRFDERPDFKRGERVNFGEMSSGSAGGNVSRKYSMTLSFSMDSVTANAGGSDVETDSLEFSSIVKLNKGTFEFGGGLTYSSEDESGSDVTTYSFIGVGEYNFVKNKPGKKFVPAVQGQIGISNYEATGGVSGNGLLLGLNGRLKVFPWNDSLAIVAAIGMTSATVELGGGTDLELDRFGTTVGFQGYF